MPGDVIKVEMSYTKLLVPTDKEYEFIYPTVVGPRYSNQQAVAAPASEHWVRKPYLHQGETAPFACDIKVNIAAGMPIRKISSPSHKVNVHYTGNTVATVALDQTKTTAGNKDYILKYRLAGNQIEAGLLLSQGEKESFFLLMLQPPRRVKLEQIPGCDYVFIVDVSGSMYGYPLDISKKLLKDLIGNLRPTDTFNVLLFSGGNSVLSERSLPATAENISKAVKLIERQQGGGGTELLPALKRALALPKSENVSRSVVIVTDGYVSVEAEAFDLIRNNLGNANLFAFGIGTSVNRHLIEGMARVGMGEPFVLTKQEEAPKQADAFRTLIQSPVLTRVKVDFNGFETYDVEPATIPDVLADRPVIVFGKWRGKPQGTIAVKGFTGEGEYQDAVEVSSVKPAKANSALRYLWARHRIALLSDYNLLQQNDKRVKEVTELGLAYNLLTNYTSFVAIDSEIRNKDGKTMTVKQPLPLPEGVSDYAVGGFAAPAPMTSAPMKMLSRQSLPEEATADRSAKDKAEKKEKSASVKVGEVTATGGLTKDAIKKTAELNLKTVRACLPTIQPNAKVSIKLLINADGTVKSAKVAGGDIKDKTILKCLQKLIKGWKFEKSSVGKETEAAITLQIGS